VNDPAYIALIANGPIYSFQDANDDVTYWNAQLTDELFNRAVFVEEGQIDRRELYSDMTYINAFLYAPLQRARFLGEDATKRLKLLLADSASRDLRVGRALAYAGMGYVYLGEMMCATPIDLGVPKTSEEMFADAITRSTRRSRSPLRQKPTSARCRHRTLTPSPLQTLCATSRWSARRAQPSVATTRRKRSSSPIKYRRRSSSGRITRTTPPRS
jgi:hypothetical protein